MNFFCTFGPQYEKKYLNIIQQFSDLKKKIKNLFLTITMKRVNNHFIDIYKYCHLF